MSKHQILIITGDAGESFEVLYAKHRMLEAGHDVTIAAPSKKRMNLVIHDFDPDWDTYVERPGYVVESDIGFQDVDPNRYTAVLLVGGRAPEYLRHDQTVVDLVTHFHESGKYIFAICHGVQILIAAGLIEQKPVSCYENIRFEVESCNGYYVSSKEATRVGNLVTGKTWQSHPEFYQLVFECLDSSVPEVVS